ncbi:MAG TPA: hypothetical protein PKX38_03925 [Alphaproteobacteria bacterium]|nr:hypothetical protein [Micavibrio sp.]HQX27067.1 hypothetical protein [Alphaproteobacteria bacterium]
MRNSVKASFFTACVLAANELISGPDAALANIPPKGEIAPMPPRWVSPPPAVVQKELRALFKICDPRAIKYTMLVFQTMKPQHPEEVPQEVYDDIRETFMDAAQKMFEYTRDITAEPMEDEDLRKALLKKHRELTEQQINKIDLILNEAWPAPRPFDTEEFGKIELAVDFDGTPGACVLPAQSL